ncbi:MAG: sigma-54-dependent Fis family transcriptional regulator [Flavobacteriales bacterium]|nr:sigma-54-dependent Fis family transcriptional regulator [Flavobacteriales bacterium]
MPTIQDIKRRFEIIGNNDGLNLAIDKAIQIAPTDISVLITGESGVGKENIPKIIHQLSHRKHGSYIAVNCGAIPEGTIDSELFGHEKGAFTGATTTRKGYFEVADKGTIFLDEVGELPLTTQVRLLRILENGEFMKVGSSNIQKTDVRIIAATNLNMPEAISKQKFREDLFYRLNTIEIHLPPLRERKEDIHLLFRKFAIDFAEKYRMPVLRLDPDAVILLEKHRWPGNIRQLRNFAEQISVVEKNRLITPELLSTYLPETTKHNYPVVSGSEKSDPDLANERNVLYGVLFELRSQIDDLKQLTLEFIKDNNNLAFYEKNHKLITKLFGDEEKIKDENMSTSLVPVKNSLPLEYGSQNDNNFYEDDHDQHIIDIEESTSLSLIDKEIELIKKSLEKNKGKRKDAAKELGISERTLYRKIKQFNL